MSFVDLATLTLHRRHEMESRISTFASKCDSAINNIRKLKAQTRTFVDKLNCEPPELKERFLSCMKRLDEYIYLMTEFNLSIENLEKNGSMELAPVHDCNNSYKNYPVLTPTNLMDVLSEPAATTSAACSNLCPAEKPHTRRRQKAEQLLITFSSSSCSAESVPEANETVDKEVQCVVEAAEDLTITGHKGHFYMSESTGISQEETTVEKKRRKKLNNPMAMVNLPAQSTLDTDKVYEATIMSVDGSTLYIITEPAEHIYNFLYEMTKHYQRAENRVSVSIDDVPNFTCCVFDDAHDTQCYFRALFIRAAEDNTSNAQVFLVDTGELRPVTAGCIQPIAPRFTTQPPYARCCHLADVDFLNSSNKERLEEFFKQFLGKPYSMKVDDNSSESLGVYLFVDGEVTLNERLVQEGLATALEKPTRPEVEEARGPPELARADSVVDLHQLDIRCPEHEDPVEAVAGYHNRDEIDICKHYKGGPEKTCFKGARCRKRHVVQHPDGWTLDRVSVPAKCRPLPLPAPGSWHKVLVTFVCHFDRLYVHFDQHKVKEELPSFGVVLPPMTLDSLVRDMNSPATYAAFRPLQMAPAPGELVAAKYRDGLWYRARVNCATRADQCVEVMYIDYGNVVSVKENEIMCLESRFTALPAQAVLCRLAGVAKLSEDSRRWAAAKARLAKLAQDHAMEMQVIARGYDELTVEMFDAKGMNLAHQLAAGGDVSYHQDYDVEDDSHRRFRLVQP